jgi:hypothetical protein
VGPKTSTRSELTSSRAHPLLLIEPSAKTLVFKQPPHAFNSCDNEEKKVTVTQNLENFPYIKTKDDFIQEYLDRFGDGFFVICEDCIQE